MIRISHFSWEITLVLLLKVFLIFGLWFLFFRAEEVPTADQVSRAVLGSANQQGVNANDQH